MLRLKELIELKLIWLGNLFHTLMTLSQKTKVITGSKNPEVIVSADPNNPNRVPNPSLIKQEYGKVNVRAHSYAQ